MSSRIVGGVMNYFLPFILLFVFLFVLEWVIELILGIIGTAVGGDTTPNFPGPTDLIQSAIYTFPDVWDLGSAIYFGGIGQAMYLVYILLMILGATSLVLIGKTLLLTLAQTTKIISDDAIAKAGAKFGDISSRKTTSGGNGGGDSGDNGNGDPKPRDDKLF